jgi:hypothetical protein
MYRFRGTYEEAVISGRGDNMGCLLLFSGTKAIALYHF